MEISIRPYMDSDFDAVTSIWFSSWQSTGVHAPVTLSELRERWPQELAKGWTVHVATAGPDVIGFLARRKADGVKLENCPAYIREWMERDKD